jgi:hypothetical protein
MTRHSAVPMTIHDWFDGPYPARVRIAIAEKNLQAQVRFEPAWGRRSSSTRMPNGVCASATAPYARWATSMGC